MKDIEPNPKLNKIAASLIGIIAIFPIYLAYDTRISYVHTVVDSNQGDFLAAMVGFLAGIGCILLLCALLLWRRPPINAARLHFRSGGFRLETRQVFRGHKVANLDWADVTTVTMRNGGLYGGRSIQVAHGRAGEIGFFSPSWTQCSSKDIVDRLQASAEASGYTFEKGVDRWFTHSRKRWTVIQKT